MDSKKFIILFLLLFFARISLAIDITCNTYSSSGQCNVGPAACYNNVASTFTCSGPNPTCDAPSSTMSCYNPFAGTYYCQNGAQICDPGSAPPPPPPSPSTPSITVTSSPTNGSTVNPGTSVTINWSSSNTTFCSASWFNIGGGVGTSGSNTVTINSTATYTITCSDNSGNSASDSSTINVSVAFPTVTLTITLTNGSPVASGSTVDPGTPIIVSWSSTNASYCQVSWVSGNANTSGGPIPFTVDYDSSYTITCYNSVGASQSQTTNIYAQIQMLATGAGPVIPNAPDPAGSYYGDYIMMIVGTPIDLYAQGGTGQFFWHVPSNMQVINLSPNGSAVQLIATSIGGCDQSTGRLVRNRIGEYVFSCQILVSSYSSLTCTASQCPDSLHYQACPAYCPNNYSQTNLLITTPPPTSYTLNVSLNGAGNGTVTGGGINCPGVCSTSCTGPVTLNANPSGNSTFAGWSGDCSGTGTCTVPCSGNANVTATFNSSLSPAHISLSPVSFSFTGISGGATPSGQTLNILDNGGATLNWSASPSQNWCHINPTSGSISQGSNANATVSVDAPSNIGNFSCTISISGSGADNSPQNVGVTYSIVSSGVPSPALQCSPSSCSVNQGQNIDFLNKSTP